MAPFLEPIAIVSGGLIIVMGILVFADSVINLNTVFSFAEVDQVSGTVSLDATGLLIAFITGIVSVISPCVLPMIPVYMLYITGSSTNEAGEVVAARTPFFHAVFSFSVSDSSSSFSEPPSASSAPSFATTCSTELPACC